jgi:DNA-binding NtrC family response regulator
MARVLVAHADEGVREAVAATLGEEAGHTVVATSDSMSAIAALWLSAGPMVALIDERLLPFGGLDVFGVVANDSAARSLARHRYVLLSTWPEHIQSHGRRLLARLGAPVLPLPFELDALIGVVDEAAEAIVAGRHVSSALGCDYAPRVPWQEPSRHAPVLP